MKKAATISKIYVLNADITQNNGQMESSVMKKLLAAPVFLLFLSFCCLANAKDGRVKCYPSHADSGWESISTRKLKEDVVIAANTKSIKHLINKIGKEYSAESFSGATAKRWLYGSSRRSVTSDCKTPAYTERTFEFYQLIMVLDKTNGLQCKVYRKTHLTKQKTISPLSDRDVLPFSVSLMSCKDWLKQDEP